MPTTSGYGRRLPAAPDRHDVVGRGLVGVAEVIQPGQHLLGVETGPGGEGVEADPPQVEHLVAQHVADRAQLAAKAQVLAQDAGDAVATAVTKDRELDGDQRQSR